MSRFRNLLRAAVTAAATAAAADRAAAQSYSAPPAGGAAVPCQPTPACPPAQPYAVFPGAQPGQPGVPTAQTPTPQAAAEPTPSFASTLAGAGAGESTAVGMGAYIDNAAPVTMFRLRYDAAYDNNRPDRAEFFYAKCGCLRLAQPPQLDAHGPPLTETRVDYQELAPYLEYAIVPRLSVFATVPIRFINPEQNRNAAGLSDVSFGAKYAVVYDPCRVLSIQVRAIAPSGDTGLGLGTGNWFIEPGLLYQEQLSPRWQLFGQVKDQIPVDRQSDFTGNVLTYGIGTSVAALSNDWGYVAPVAEFVGWSVLSGKELNELGQVLSARGDTIVNAKFGLRVGFGGNNCGGGPYQTPNDIYIGYGRALTGEVWYKDILRLEYRRFF